MIKTPVKMTITNICGSSRPFWPKNRDLQLDGAIEIFPHNFEILIAIRSVLLVLETNSMPELMGHDAAI